MPYERRKTMKKSIVFTSSLLLLCLFVDTHPNTTKTQTAIDKEDSQINYEKFEQLLEKLTNQWRIPGMSIAVIHNGKIDYCQSFGVKKVHLNDKVNEDTIFDAASLTKPLFAYLIMQFVEKGVIDLEKPIIDYLKGTTIMEDYLAKFDYRLNQDGFRTDWFSLITPKHILSHSAGFPHGETYQANKPDVYPIFFKPGTQFKYSAEGYYILQKIIEHLTGQPVEELMKKYIFTPLNMTDSYMVWSEKISDNAAYGHSAINVPAKTLRKAMKSHAGGSLYTTAKDYAKFLTGVLNKKGLSDSTFKMMFEPVVSIENGVSYAPGFTVEKSSRGICCWHTGDYAVFRNFAYANIDEKYGVVFFTNSFYGLAIYPDVMNALFKGDYPVLQCDFLKYYRNLDVFSRILTNPDEAFKYFSTDAFRQRPSFKHLELFIDWMADLYKAENKMEPAIKLCNYNTRTFPNSANAWYYLGEAYMKAGQNDEAILSYKKSLEINPENQNAKEMLKKLE